MADRCSESTTGVTNPSFTAEEGVVIGNSLDGECNGNEPIDGPKLALRTKLFVYVSHFLSAWGDRMWTFGVGLFLIRLSPDSLQLVAIYGFSTGAAVLLFAAIIGDWIDNTPRLRAARLSLVLQNVLVAICSGVVFAVVFFEEVLRGVWTNEVAWKVSHAVIIIVAILADLASISRKIAVERDWVVEICGRDKDLLASMTSLMRAIDLTTAILAPVATGQIIHYIALQYAAVFIAGWNIVSVFVEYGLIMKVYEAVPALKSKMNKKRNDEVISNENVEMEEIDLQMNDIEPHEQDTNAEVEDRQNVTPQATKAEEEKSRFPPFVYTMFKSFIILVKGWKTFMKYDVAFAGLGLASLYMTVLGFDSITVGFAYSQGISESILGILMAAGSIFGIAGTFAYPRFQRSFGLERTGLYGFFSEIFCLLFCVASVFAPGSPFDLTKSNNVDEASSNSSIITTLAPVSTQVVSHNVTNLSGSLFIDNTTLPSDRVSTERQSSFISIGLYLGGLITARFGLWIADLTITQLFLESVTETERGIVSGIQRSLNQLMDMLKFLMVILAPYPEQYGLLVFISFTFVCFGGTLYAKYSYSKRGHFFHFEKICSADKQNNNIRTDLGDSAISIPSISKSNVV